MASYKIQLSKKLRKDFRKIPKRDVEKILAEIWKLSEQPLPANTKKLKGEELYRMRVGIYRVIYTIEDDRLVVMVIKVAHRKDVYRDL